jgi:hypothetical protein
LPGRTAAIEGAFAANEIPRLARRFACPCRVDALPMMRLRPRVLFEELPELVVDDRLDDALDLGVPELRLGLSLELRPWNLHADHAGQPFADVVAADAGVLQVLGQVVLTA